MRRLLLNTLGLALHIAVHPANIPDRESAKRVLMGVHKRFPHLNLTRAAMFVLTSVVMSDIILTFIGRFRWPTWEGLMAVAQAAETLITQAHREAMRVSTAAGATALRDVLTPRLVAYITGVDATRTVARWARGETAHLRSDHATRLRTAYEIVRLLEGAHEAPATIQAWFLGMNPVLDDCSPARAVREGDYAGARAAAVTFLAEG